MWIVAFLISAILITTAASPAVNRDDDGGNPFGSHNTPVGTVDPGSNTVGVGAGGGGNGGGGGGGGGASNCRYAVVTYDQALTLAYGLTGAPPPTGDPSFADTLWIATWCRQADGSERLVGLSPYSPVNIPVQALLAQAWNSMSIPTPEPRFSPDAADWTLVGMETWMWVDEADWQPQRAQACISGAANACVAIEATPQQLGAAMGDGEALTCDGRGVPYDFGRAYDSQRDAEGRCAHVYIWDSHDRADGRYPVLATVTWSRTWSCWFSAGGGRDSCGGGALPDWPAASPPVPLDVREAQAVLVVD